MTQSALAPRYDRWKAPAENGQTLIWPPPRQLLADTRDNHAQLSGAQAARIQNIPLNEVRASLRQWLGHTDEARPIIATGHQAELHHPGVWVKNALINAAADKLAGRAMHFAVDTDEPKHLNLRWPGGAMQLADETRLDAAWSALLPAPSPAHLDRVSESFERAARHWNFQTQVPHFLASMRRLTLDAPTLPAALTNAIHELDWSLGLRHDALLASPLCLSEPYLAFVHHVLARAGEFANDYNAALEQFRRENKIKTPGRPMPNLSCANEACEVPFWLDDLSLGLRTRAAVHREGEQFELRLANGERFALDPAADGWTAASRLLRFCRQQGVRLAPRALTLTAVLRLLVADQFVHGIGGGQYDQVLDALIARQFKLSAPRFSVTTATLYFPAAAGQTRACLPCVAQEGRRLRHSILGSEKMQLVEAIAAAPRHSAHRSTLFHDMHNRLLAARNRPELRQWEARAQSARLRLEEEKTIFDREFFYAIQPTDRLAGMIDKYRDAFA